MTTKLKSDTTGITCNDCGGTDYPGEEECPASDDHENITKAVFTVCDKTLEECADDTHHPVYGAHVTNPEYT